MFSIFCLLRSSTAVCCMLFTMRRNCKLCNNVLKFEWGFDFSKRERKQNAALLLYLLAWCDCACICLLFFSFLLSVPHSLRLNCVYTICFLFVSVCFCFWCFFSCIYYFLSLCVIVVVYYCCCLFLSLNWAFVPVSFYCEIGIAWVLIRIRNFQSATTTNDDK